MHYVYYHAYDCMADFETVPDVIKNYTTMKGGVMRNRFVESHV